jgi:hypothetical protein
MLITGSAVAKPRVRLHLADRLDRLDRRAAELHLELEPAPVQYGLIHPASPPPHARNEISFTGTYHGTASLSAASIVAQARA